jgi:transketolase
MESGPDIPHELSAAPAPAPRAGAADPALLAAHLRRHVPEGGGAGLGLAASLLVSRHVRFDSADPFWADRDRILSAPELAPLGQAIGRLAGSAGLVGVASQALGCGVGLALAERLLAGRFGRSLVDHRVWVLCAGADLATGAAQEAAWLAGAWRLGRLAVIVEDAPRGTPGLSGFAASGWTIRHTNGASAAEITAALSAALRSVKPTLVACAGTPPAAGTDDRTEPWLATGGRLAGIRRSWIKRLARHGSRADFDGAVAGRLPLRWHAPLSEPGSLEGTGGVKLSTAQCIRAALPGLTATMGSLSLLPGDAAWPPPAGQADPPQATAGTARRLALGMGAVLCGVAWHGGIVPVCVQPDGAADSLLPGLRDAAASGARLVVVMVEGAAADAAAALHAVANLAIFRPADPTEALECLELAVRRTGGPSVLLVSHRAVPLLAERPSRTHASRGGYLAWEPEGSRAATLLASGPELHAALLARARLAAADIAVAVVSLPCAFLFAQQEAAWRDTILGGAPCIALAGGGGGAAGGDGLGWDRWLGRDGLVIGESDPHAVAERVARHLRGRGSVWTGASGS